MPQLTVERLFASPGLQGELPSHVQFAPDAASITWLALAEDDRERLDLWRYDVATGSTERVINAATLDHAGVLSDAEKAERERKRQFSGGVTSYLWSPSGAHIAATIDGCIYLLEPATGSLQAITEPGTRQTDLRFAPDGSALAFVRDYNLWVYQLAAGVAQPFTTDGTAVRHYGLPEFIAQEEMHRFDGYWWLSDSSGLLYTVVDNATVTQSQRYEIDADELRVVAQRYPYAGAANAQVELRTASLADGPPGARTVPWAYAPDDYLARVKVSANDVYVQTQNRAQQRLTLRRFDVRDLTIPAVTVLEETSPTWVNLHDDLFVVPTAAGERQLLWVSERDGHAHLYRYRARTADPTASYSCEQLTSGRGRVNQLHQANGAQAYFSGWFSDPTEQHVYRIELPATGPQVAQPQPLTRGPAWHQATFAKDASAFIDRHSSYELPAALDLCRLSTAQQADPADLPRRNIATQAITADHPYHPYWPQHVQPEVGALPGADGRPLYYRLTQPATLYHGTAPADERFPVVVYVYGGPGAQRVTRGWPPLLLQLFAHNGFGVLELDNRGSANRGKGFEDAIHRSLGDVEVADQLLGARLLREQPWVDPARIGVFGHSYGGYMTLLCLCKAPDVFAAGVAVAPVSRWELYDTHYTERYLGTPNDNPAGYLHSSVLPHLPGLHKLRGELLLMHGMADDNVLFTHSTVLYKSLQDANIPFQMMTYPGSKHALQETSVSIHRFETILRFFRRVL